MTAPQTYFDPATGQTYVAVNGQWQPMPAAAPAPPTFPPAQQYAPMAAPQYAQALPGYPPQVYPGQPQVYGMPAGAPQQAPAPVLAKGSLADFYGQPSSGGGKSVSFKDKPIGTEYLMLVTRAITAGDIEQQTEISSDRPAFFRDGRPKFVLKVPVKIAPSPDYPDGTARWFVQGASRDELTRAMTEAGVPLDTEGRPQPPEAGAVIHIQLTGMRPVPNMSPAKVIAVRYWRPSDPYAQQVAQFLGSAPVQAPAAVQQLQQAPAPVQQYAAPPQYAPQMAAQPQYVSSLAQYAPAPAAAPQPPPPPAPAQAAPTTPAPQQAPAPAQAAPAPVQQLPTGPVPAQPPAQQWTAAPGVPQLDAAGQETLRLLLAGQVPAAPAG